MASLPRLAPLGAVPPSRRSSSNSELGGDEPVPMWMRLFVPPQEWPSILSAVDVAEGWTSAVGSIYELEPFEFEEDFTILYEDDYRDAAATGASSGASTADLSGGDVPDLVRHTHMEELRARLRPMHPRTAALCCLVRQLAGPLFCDVPWGTSMPLPSSPAPPPPQPQGVPSRRPPLNSAHLCPRRVFLTEGSAFNGHGCAVKMLTARRTHDAEGGEDVSGAVMLWSPRCAVHRSGRAGARDADAAAEELAVLEHLGATARLHGPHPNLVSVLGVVDPAACVCACAYERSAPPAPAAMGAESAGEEQGPRAALMEYVAGGAWCDFLATYEAHVSPRCVLRWFADVVAGLSHLHDVCGVRHRNLTPANVLVRLDPHERRGPVDTATATPADIQTALRELAPHECVQPLLSLLMDAASVSPPSVRHVASRAVAGLLARTELVLSGLGCAAPLGAARLRSSGSRSTVEGEDAADGSTAAAGVEDGGGEYAWQQTAQEPPSHQRRDAVSGPVRPASEPLADAPSAGSDDLWNAALAFYLLLAGGAEVVAGGWAAVAGDNVAADAAAPWSLPTLVALREAGAASCLPQPPQPPHRAAFWAKAAVRLHTRWAMLPQLFLELLDAILAQGPAPAAVTAASAHACMQRILAAPATLPLCPLAVFPPMPVLLLLLLKRGVGRLQADPMWVPVVPGSAQGWIAVECFRVG